MYTVKFICSIYFCSTTPIGNTPYYVRVYNDAELLSIGFPTFFTCARGAKEYKCDQFPDF